MRLWVGPLGEQRHHTLVYNRTGAGTLTGNLFEGADNDPIRNRDNGAGSRLVVCRDGQIRRVGND